MVENKYQPCPCGSGRKLKFCCYEKSASLNTMSDSELIRRGDEFPVYRCLVSRNWHEQGLAPLFVVRQLPNLTYLVGVYLIDVFCLGIKETFVQTRIKYEDLRDLLKRFPLQFDEIDYEDARSIIMGAAEYARQLGFEPHYEWSASGWIVESGRPFNNKFTFGKDGKPFCILGPEDDSKEIMKRLEPLIEKGNADYLIVEDPETFRELVNDDFDEVEFLAWCDEILDLLEDGCFDDARAEIKDIRDEFPERSEPFFLMGTCLTMEDKSEEATLRAPTG